jgi:hypothetical protein
MNQHLLVKMRQLGTPHRCVANLGNRLAITSDWRLDLDRSGAPGPALRHCPYAAE